LSAYTGSVGAGDALSVATVLAGKGSYTSDVSTGGAPQLLGVPKSGVLVQPSVSQANLLSEAQNYLQSQAAFGSGILSPQARDSGQEGQPKSTGGTGGQGINAASAAARGAGGQGGQGGRFGGGAAFLPLTSVCGLSGNGNNCGLLNGSNGQDASVFPPQSASGGASGQPRVGSR
jgi:hypothetical protein